MEPSSRSSTPASLSPADLGNGPRSLGLRSPRPDPRVPCPRQPPPPLLAAARRRTAPPLPLCLPRSRRDQGGGPPSRLVGLSRPAGPDPFATRPSAPPHPDGLLPLQLGQEPMVSCPPSGSLVFFLLLAQSAPDSAHIMFFSAPGIFPIYPEMASFAEKTLMFMHIITHNSCIGLK